jgi:cytochrome c553
MNLKLIAKTMLATALLAAFINGNARAEEASVIWTKTCAACHGKDGKGNTKMGRKVDVKDYTDPKVQADLTDEKGIKALKEGIKDDKGKERMKAYGDQLSDEEIKSLVAYVRAFKPQ